MNFTCTIKEYEALNNMYLKGASDLKILFSFTWEDGRVTEEKARVLFTDHTLKHEIEHIAYRDFESTIDIGIIEAIWHSAIGNNIKKEYRSIDSMKQGA